MIALKFNPRASFCIVLKIKFFQNTYNGGTGANDLDFM